MTPIQTTNHPDRETKWINFFPSPTQLMRNVNRIALPAIALFSASALHSANGGPVSWAICVAACEAVAISATAATAGAAAASLIACVKACQIVMYAPFCP